MPPGSVPVLFPGLIIPGRRRRAAGSASVLSPLHRSNAFPARAEHVLPLPPAPARQHVPGAAAASSRCLCACCWHGTAACQLSLLALPCIPASPGLPQLSLQLRLGVMHIPPLLLLLHLTASAQLPSFISVPKHGRLHWICSFGGEKKILFETGLLVVNWIFTHFLLTPFPPPVLVPVGRPKTCWVQHKLSAGFALEGGCSKQGGSSRSSSSEISPL